jgi:hypothetical protein
VSPALAELPLVGIEQFPTVDEALGTAFEMMGSDAKVLVLPQGGSTLPQLVGTTPD